MKLIEKHVVRQGTRKWKEIDDLAFKSKNLYNRANYEIRQHFFKTQQNLAVVVLSVGCTNQKSASNSTPTSTAVTTSFVK